MIRKYENKDLNAKLAVWSSASQVGHPFLDEDFLAGERKMVAEGNFPNAETWVFELDGAVVGFIVLIGNEVGAIFVDANHHGQGIGRALMDHAASIRDCLELEVFKDNQVGRSFYDKYGFTQVNEYLHEETNRMMLRLKLPC
jgi:putative acetyltransferase